MQISEYHSRKLLKSLANAEPDPLVTVTVSRRSSMHEYTVAMVMRTRFSRWLAGNSSTKIFAMYCKSLVKRHLGPWMSPL